MDWQRLLVEMRQHKSYRAIAEEAQVSKDTVYRLAEGSTTEPRHSDGERLKELHKHLCGLISQICD